MPTRKFQGVSHPVPNLAEPEFEEPKSSAESVLILMHHMYTANVFKIRMEADTGGPGEHVPRPHTPKSIFFVNTLIF